jgi:prephenate dehydratase
MKKIVYQGKSGAYSHIVGLKFFGKNNLFFGKKDFKEIFEDIDKNKADFATVPIENSLVGSVYENYDYLDKYNVEVVGEIYLRIKHNLLGVKIKNLPLKQRLKLIQKVYSHPKALEQCQKFFEKHPWMEKVSFYDTAMSAEFLAKSGDISLGAIASKLAGKIYNLDVILSGIEDDKNNYTRFLIVQKRKNKNLTIPSKVNKCSLIFSLKHKPGTLYKALAVLAQFQVNLTKIESRPIIGKPFEYKFYVDFEFNSKIKNKLEEILNIFKKQTTKLKVLGYYSKGKYVVE